MNNQNNTIVYLSLGSNIEDRVRYLSSAVDSLKNNPYITVLKQSKIYETEPWPKKDQTWFLNQVIKIETSLNPQELLDVTQNIEKGMGRESKGDLSDRTIDIDILLFDNEIIDLPNLQIPHRHMNDRQFVLIPLIEIEPELKDPITSKKYELILKNIKVEHKVRQYLSSPRTP